ncbi:MAG TPA: hypothetical protein VMQ93_02830 [Novosphingobium sp.]|nr:hypothetical protein [Novosphingobium sp.]
MMSGHLPAGFESLEPYVAQWSGRTAAERAGLRAMFGPDERAAFHAACTPLVKDGLALLDARPLPDLSPAERRLLDLFLAYAHVSLAIDVQAGDEDRHSPLRESMRITREPADF